MNCTKFLVLGALLFAYCLGCVYSLAYESAKEGMKCKEFPTVKTDLQWMMSVKKWYYIAMSRLDLYTFSAYILGKDPNDIQEDEVYYDSCITYASTPDFKFSVVGYKGHEKILPVEVLDDHFGKMKLSGDNGGLASMTYTTLTDNKTFQFMVTCYEDVEEMVWGVGSPYKSLPKETMKIIHEHAESLGFKKEYFTSQRYDHCKDTDEEEDKSKKTEL